MFDILFGLFFSFYYYYFLFSCKQPQQLLIDIISYSYLCNYLFKPLWNGNKSKRRKRKRKRKRKRREQAIYITNWLIRGLSYIQNCKKTKQYILIYLNLIGGKKRAFSSCRFRFLFLFSPHLSPSLVFFYSPIPCLC